MNKSVLVLIIPALIFIFNICGAISQNKAYKGAEIYSHSQHYVQYGKIEVRMMAAKGSGLLSTFFTWKEGSEQPSVFWEEIDVEIFGKNNAATWQSNIITGYDPRNLSEQVHNQNISLADDFHNYSIEWTPEYVAWIFDGQQVRKTSGQPATDLKSPAGIRFNIWASTATSWVGPWDDSVLPQYQFVNWIKYYAYNDGEFTLDWVDDFDSFNGSRWGKANWTFDGNRVDFEPQNALVQDGMLILCLTKAGKTGFSGVVPQDTSDTSTAINENRLKLNGFRLRQNYPNPFNPATTIRYFLNSESNVEVIVYGLNGRIVKSLLDKSQSAGEHSIYFDGSGLPSGIYFYKLKAGASEQVRKMVLIR